MSNQPVIDFSRSAAGSGSLDVRWIHGSPSAKHNADPDIQVHEYNEHTLILRQNMAIDYEAPFIFLLFGNDRALLLDTGATASADFFPLRRVVDALIERWREAHPRPGYELLIVHTHGHGDHVAGDAQFRNRACTVIVEGTRSGLQKWFGSDDRDDNDGADTVQVDLGGRVLECLATPGHEEAAITVYDPWTGLLLTGDTVYPGRLYVEDWPAFTSSIEKLIEFTGTRPVTHVLGAHIEMTTTPGVDYPIRTTYQPEEPPLEMTTDHLRRIRAAIEEIGEQPGRHVYPDFIICRSEP